MVWIQRLLWKSNNSVFVATVGIKSWHSLIRWVWGFPWRSRGSPLFSGLSFGLLAFMWLELLLAPGGFSFSEKDALQFCGCFWKSHFRRKPGELPSRHLQLTSTGKMWLTQMTVSSVHGHYSESGCCLGAKSLEIIMTSALLLKTWLYTHRKQGGGRWGDSHKNATVLAIWGIRLTQSKNEAKCSAWSKSATEGRPADPQRCFQK